MSVFIKLIEVQNELKAPKSQYNSFGKYNYRNCEDILEAVKPICAKYSAATFLTDKIVMVGDRYYVEATAHFVDIESGDEITACAYAREEAEKKGMDGSQVTGASSSYARKYALNGLFAIDDTKDSDTSNTHGKEERKEDETMKANPVKASNTLRQELATLLVAHGIDVKQYAAEKGIGKDTPESVIIACIEELKKI